VTSHGGGHLLEVCSRATRDGDLSTVSYSVNARRPRSTSSLPPSTSGATDHSSDEDAEASHDDVLAIGVAAIAVGIVVALRIRVRRPWRRR
jgi:hypothetical protein